MNNDTNVIRSLLELVKLGQPVMWGRTVKERWWFRKMVIAIKKIPVIRFDPNIYRANKGELTHRVGRGQCVILDCFRISDACHRIQSIHGCKYVMAKTRLQVWLDYKI